MSAGSGIRHSEMNHSTTEPVHFVQMWVVPDTAGIAPGYEQLDVNDRVAEGGLVAVASGRGHEGAVHIHQRGAVMWVGRLSDGETVTLPDAPFVHVFAARGSLRLGDAALNEGDAARLTDAGALELTADGAAEVIVWESDASAQR
jgi:redox-sensitive bicupin YhaK (pirin superfamily)